MLYLITGVPGSGKTLKMISDLMTRDDLKNRPLYLDGIPEVDGQIIPNLPIPEGETMQTWHKWAPTGAILVIDECQRVFRPRPSGSKVPDYVAELETHRHKGIDIFIDTTSTAYRCQCQKPDRSSLPYRQNQPRRSAHGRMGKMRQPRSKRRYSKRR